MDHQMNLKVSDAFGQLYQRLPLKKSPTIVCGNALRLDWKTILPPKRCSYVLGNPRDLRAMLDSFVAPSLCAFCGIPAPFQLR
jgi:hypothetical protein